MKIYSDPILDRQLKDAQDKYDNDKERILGVCLNQPNEPLNSSSRKLMFAIQSTHKLNLLNPEVPLLGTGYENQFGYHSSSYVESNSNWSVLFRINKFSNAPDQHYYLIVVNDQNEMDIIERVSYYHSTETYGYLFNNNYLDSLNPGDVIPSGKVIKTSTAYDEYGNHMDGVNLNCCYMALSKNTEDPVIISESAAKKLAAPMIRKVEIIINDNDIPLNLYGNDSIYKIFPDIGEDIKDGIIAGVRKENKDESFFTQAISRLSSPMISDITYKLSGRVIDINVYSNKQPGDSEDDMYNCYEGQIEYYIGEDRRFCTEFLECMRNYIDNSNYKKSYELSRMYSLCESKLNGVQYIKDKSVFSNIYIEIFVYTENNIKVGDKLSNRHGGKGVVAAILPDNMMPRIVGSNKPADLVWNQATCPNRLNIAQLVEGSLNYISKNIIDYIDMHVLHAEECLELILEYLECLSPDYADSLRNYLDFGMNDDDMLTVLGSFITENEDGLYLSLKPVTECVAFDKLREIYNKFSWIHPKTLYVPIKGSNGQYRFVESNKPSIISSQYIYRMKQYAEEKHSANSLSSTNVRNENAKSRDSKMYMRTHSSTPIKMGEMESNILIHLGPEVYVTNLMLYSTSPQGRRDAEVLLTGDPYNIDVTLSDDARSRSVEKVNATLKTMGLAFRFRKIRKQKRPFTIKATKNSPFEKVVRIDKSPFERVIKSDASPFEQVVRTDKSPFEQV